MPQLVELVVLPGEQYDEARLRQKAAQQTGLRPDQISHLEMLEILAGCPLAPACFSTASRSL